MSHRRHLINVLKSVQSFRGLSSTRLPAKIDNAQMTIYPVFLRHNVECNHLRLILRGKNKDRSVQGRHIYRRTVAYCVFSSPKTRGSLVSGVSLLMTSLSTGKTDLILSVEVDSTMDMLVNYLSMVTWRDKTNLLP